MNPNRPFQDLNQLPDSAVVVPKTELLEIEPIAQLPSLNEPLQQFVPTQGLSKVESDIYAEFLRVSELFRSAFSNKMEKPMDLMVFPSNSHQQSLIRDLIVSTKKSKPRSSEMVRVGELGFEDQRYFRSLVRKTRMTFDSLRNLLIREEEERETYVGESRGRGKGRADLQASKITKGKDLWLNREKRIIGSIPGILIGDQFFFRMELCVLGLHGQCQAGIDYIPAKQSVNREPIATSIIVSGGYEDDDDQGDVIIYTGHGGKEKNVNRQILHQKLEGGNLALERSMYYGIEIRVIRGIKCEQSPTGKVYIYDGLYKVIDYWYDVGKSGFSVYKYKLVRIPDQAEMGSVIVKFAENLKVNPSLRPAGYLSLDISKGKEKVPVLLFNDIDEDHSPILFDYCSRIIYPPKVLQNLNGYGVVGCDCVSSCSEGCSCAQKNGGEFPYNRNGVLLKGKPLIYECGSLCRCSASCQSRVSQKGLEKRLEVFRSRETGWGVRTLETIPAGSFICEYAGVLLTKDLADVLTMNGDRLIYPNRFPKRWFEWGDISEIFPEFVRQAFPTLPQLNFAIDVSTMRNVACYLSHSCIPNVFVQFVLYDHFNVLYPHLMVFAMENIPPLRELSIDYGTVDSWNDKLALCN